MRASFLAVLLFAAPSFASEAFLKVEGMKTPACARNVDAILKAVAGVSEVETNQEAGVSWVRYSGRGVSARSLAKRLSAGDGKHPAHPSVAITEAQADAIVARWKATPKKTTVPAAGPLRPWEPVDETFRGCEGG